MIDTLEHTHEDFLRLGRWEGLTNNNDEFYEIFPLKWDDGISFANRYGIFLHALNVYLSPSNLYRIIGYGNKLITN